jgi:hypothetical protein
MGQNEWPARRREKKRGAFVVMTRAPRPSREERLSATKNRVRCRNRLLVNSGLTKPGFPATVSGCRDRSRVAPTGRSRATDALVRRNFARREARIEGQVEAYRRKRAGGQGPPLQARNRARSPERRTPLQSKHWGHSAARPVSGASGRDPSRASTFGDCVCAEARRKSAVAAGCVRRAAWRARQRVSQDVPGGLIDGTPGAPS